MFCAELPPRIYESLKALCCLAVHPMPMRAHVIARSTGLPAAQTAKVLQWMTWAGFVKSRRGIRGGFWLVVPPNRIRVSDVIEFFTHRDRKVEAVEADCVSDALQKAISRCQRQFQQVTVADLVQLYEEGKAKKSRRARAIAAGRT